MTDKKELKDLLNKELSQLISVDPTKETIEKAYHLIKLGADPFTHSNIPSSAYNIFAHVIEFGDVEWFKKFLEEFEFDLNNLDRARSKAFDFAILHKKSDIVRFLIQKQNISQERIQKEFYKICTTYSPKIEETIALAKVLIENGAKIYQLNQREDLAYYASLTGVNAFTKYLEKEREREKEENKVKNNIPLEKANQNAETFMKDNLALIQSLNIVAIKNGELTKYNEELAKQNEELAKQNDELAKQKEELVKQNEQLDKLYTELGVQMQILQYES